MNQVKRMMQAGVSLPTAVKELLTKEGLTVSAFAEKHNRPVTTISNVINGNVRAGDEDIAALIAEFGGDPHEWRMLLWENARPVAAAS